MSPRRVSALLLAASLWLWPVTGPHAVARAYLAPATPYSAGHRGVDLRAAEGGPDGTAAGTAVGTAVLAPADGVVRFAGWVVDRPVLSVTHADGVISSYEPVESVLSEGDHVRRGDVICTLLPGHCRSPCLHLGVRIDGEYVSPLLFLGGQPRAVLLPVRRRASR
jgi:murein DD-endopeptidase MepM/ murein hydrolase activator NlpD